MTIFGFDFFKTPDYMAGQEAGFDIAESYLKKITKDFYKDMKRGLLKARATTTTSTNHKCNCDLCEFNDKKVTL